MSLPAVSLATLDACAQAELVRRREVTALELADAAIARIERLNPQLNAVVATGYEAARVRALRRVDGASLHGVPSLI
ncbi:MAG: amidase, partial [Ferrovibrionaceae bacterium]